MFTGNKENSLGKSELEGFHDGEKREVCQCRDCFDFKGPFARKTYSAPSFDRSNINSNGGCHGRAAITRRVNYC